MNTLMQAHEGDAIIIPARTLRGRPDEILAELDEVISGMLALRAVVAPATPVHPAVRHMGVGRRTLRLVTGPFVRLARIATAPAADAFRP